jgi:tRNA threonylcarbamoyl adenosine modification protein (Sua5/YciO/YrdC/YwlC family)
MTLRQQNKQPSFAKRSRGSEESLVDGYDSSSLKLFHFPSDSPRYCTPPPPMIISPPAASRSSALAPEQGGYLRLSAEILKVSSANPDPQVIRYAAGWLNRGSVIAVPTDTLYALAADPVNLASVDQIFRVKGRPEHRALPILINSLVFAQVLARDLPDNFYRLAQACWPGPLTLVVDASNRLPLKVTANTRRVALRWPKNRIVTDLIAELGVPLTGTSANLSGSPTCESGDEVFRQLGDRIPLILDGGGTNGASPSTIVELRGEHWCIGREGAIPPDQIREALQGDDPVPA